MLGEEGRMQIVYSVALRRRKSMRIKILCRHCHQAHSGSFNCKDWIQCPPCLPFQYLTSSHSQGGKPGSQVRSTPERSTQILAMNPGLLPVYCVTLEDFLHT